MQIKRQQSLTVVDYNKIAFEEQRLRQDDASIIYGFDLRASGYAEVESLMRALYGAVKNALDSKHVGDLGIHRSRERPLPFADGAESFESLGLYFFVLLDLALVFGAGGCKARGNGQGHARIALALHSDFLFE